MSGGEDKNQNTQPEPQRYAGGTPDLSVDSKLKSALRTHTSEFINRLSLDDVKDLAYVMWSAENIDGRELDEITARTTSVEAVITLLRHVRTKGDTAIIGFAKALRFFKRNDLADKIQLSTVCTSPASFDQSTDDQLRSNFRRLIPQLHESLTLSHVHDLAHRMWSSGNLSDIDVQAITNCTQCYAAVTKLTDYAYKRGGSSITGLAKALNDIEMPHLAKKIFPEVSTPVFTMNQACDSSLDCHAEAAAATSLSQKLRNKSQDIAERLTNGEIDGIIAVLRSTKERYLTDSEYEDLKVVKGAIRKASSLIKTLLQKGDGAVQLFAKTVKDFGRQDLLNLILNDSTIGH